MAMSRESLAEPRAPWGSVTQSELQSGGTGRSLWAPPGSPFQLLCSTARIPLVLDHGRGGAEMGFTRPVVGMHRNHTGDAEAVSTHPAELKAVFVSFWAGAQPPGPSLVHIPCQHPEGKTGAALGVGRYIISPPSQPRGSCSFRPRGLSSGFNKTTNVHQRRPKTSFLAVGSGPLPPKTSPISKNHINNVGL